MSEEEIFHEALARGSPEERAAYLDRACAGDPTQRAAVEALLRANVGASGFLGPPASGSVATLDDRSIPEGPDTAVGPYRLVQPLGEGGMGTVWMARQTEPVRRLVALKVIKPGMDSRQVVARFEAERQALALMDHPNIARVLDGGTTGAGRPYFVMDLVHGVPITRYCDEHRLTPRERLGLFVDVCRAVQHAHQKGVIHRDLKPSNVLVAELDGKPVPKVIDFGVAKAAGQPLTDKTLVTGFGALVGTPLYMSPEQAGLSGLDVDTRSDVYSLGVLLYELLTGTTPFEKERLRAVGYDGLRRIICEEEAPKPSTRVNTLGRAAAAACANRRSDPKGLSRLLRGELDWVVMKALEKDRDRRYETANGLALDVQRYLADEPVLACPPSAAYRLRKFARRNKRALVTAALLGALLLVVAGSFGWLARDRAARRGRTYEAVAALLDQCEAALRADRADRAVVALGAAERRAADGGAEGLAGRLAQCRAELALLRVLDDIDTFRWSWADGGFPDPKVVVARWRAALADYGVTADEGRAAEAAAKLNGSLVREEVLTALDGWLATDRSAGVRAVLRAADPHPYRDAVRDAVAAGGGRAVATLAERPEALEQPPWFAAVLGRLNEVRALRRREVLKSALRARTGELTLLMALAQTYPAPGPEGAGERVRWYQAALAAHPGHLAALNGLGLALRTRGDLDDAVVAYREAIRLNPKYAHAHHNLGVALRAKGDLDGAVAAYREAIRLNPEDAHAHRSLGLALTDKGDRDGALAAFKEAVRADPHYVNGHDSLGTALRSRGDLDGAVAALKEAIRLDPGHAVSHNNLGNALQAKGDSNGALACFREATRLDPQLADAHTNLGLVLQAKGDRDGALAAFKEAVRADPKLGRAHNSLAFALRSRGDLDGAVAALKEAIRAEPKYAGAHYNLGLVLQEKGDADGAIGCFREAIRANAKYADAHLSLGAVLCDVKRDYDGAITAFREAIRLAPKYANAHYNLGVALWGKGDRDGAIASFREATRLAPRHAFARCELGLALQEKGDTDGAVASLKKAVRLAPKYAQAHNGLGAALRAKGDADGAAACFREAVRLDPKYANAHNNLALLLATGPDRVRDGKRAVEHATRACELTGWKEPGCIAALAAAHAEAGHFDRAVEYQKKALSFPDYERQLGKAGQERLQLYAGKKPYRGP